MASTARIDELKKKFDENPRRYFAPLANEFRKAGDIEQAIIICEEFLPQQPGHMSGHIVYGQALYEAGRMPESRTVFETALGLDPENLIALRHLGDIARGQGEAGAARSWYMRVLDADPRNEEIQAQIASLDGTPAIEKEEEKELSFGPRSESAADTVVIPAAQLLDIEREESPLQEIPEDKRDTTPAGVPIIPSVAQLTPPAGVDLLDGFSLTGLEGTSAHAHQDEAAHAPAEGFETTSFTPPEEAISTEALDDSLESGVPSFEAPSSPIAALDGFEGGAGISADDLRESAPPAVEMDIDDLALDDGLVLPPQGDALATPINNQVIQRAPVSSMTPTAPMPAYPRPDDWPAPAQAMSPVDEFDIPEIPAARDEPEPMVSEDEGSDAFTDFDLPAAATDTIPAELPPEVISAEAALTEVDAALVPQDAAGAMGEEMPAAPAPFVTETMAELYVAQGFHEQARAVYAQLLANNPGDERLEGLVAAFDARQDDGESGPTVREFFARMAARRPVSRAASVPPADDDFASSAPAYEPQPEPEPEQQQEPVAEAELPVRDLVDDAPPAVGEEMPEQMTETFEAPSVPRSMTPEYVPEVIAPAIERAAAMRTPGGSIDALFGNRAPGTSEDSAASALAQAFGATAEDAPSIVGRPARAATAELSLDSVFRDGGARPPRTSQSFSFDQFFAGGDAKSVSGPRNSGELGDADVPAERSADDIEQFNSWLQGLKPR
ncbi:MAG: tetratricopeptide repeat protein [Gemmatimonadaceae bacterium]